MHKIFVYCVFLWGLLSTVMACFGMKMDIVVDHEKTIQPLSSFYVKSNCYFNLYRDGCAHPHEFMDFNTLSEKHPDTCLVYARDRSAYLKENSIKIKKFGILNASLLDALDNIVKDKNGECLLYAKLNENEFARITKVEKKTLCRIDIEENRQVLDLLEKHNLISQTTPTIDQKPFEEQDDDKPSFISSYWYPILTATAITLVALTTLILMMIKKYNAHVALK